VRQLLHDLAHDLDAGRARQRRELREFRRQRRAAIADVDRGQQRALRARRDLVQPCVALMVAISHASPSL